MTCTRTSQTGKQQISRRVVMDDKNQSEQFQGILGEPHTRRDVTASSYPRRLISTHMGQEADELCFKCLWCLHCDLVFFI